MNKVQGNLLGTDITGKEPLGNTDGAIAVQEGSCNNLIGGYTGAERNVISGNQKSAIAVFVSSDNNKIIGNYIGTDIRGRESLPNEFGINLAGSTSNTLIAKNIIAFNLSEGILICTCQPAFPDIVYNRYVTITKNSIFSNGLLGIDFDGGGFTPNDPGDTDEGQNDLLNFPVLTYAKASPGKLHIKGTIDTQNPADATIEFFANFVPNPGVDPSGYGEGTFYLGSTKPNPQGKIVANLPYVEPGTFISATATDAAGNTSEFSENIEVRR